MFRSKVVFYIFALCLFAAAAGYGQQTAPSIGWAKYDGGKVRYIDSGRKNAKAIILVHGWTCSAELWNGSISAFPDYRVIAVDLPGHGQSDKPHANYTMEYFARAIEAVMKDAKVNRAVLIGHSMGTPVVRQFYRLFPEQMLGMVIVDGPLLPFAPRAQMETFIAPLRADFTKSATPVIDGMVAKIKDDTMKKTIRDTMLATPGYVGVSAMEGMCDDAIWGSDTINVPVLAIMNGDRPWPKDTEANFKKIAPNMDYVAWTGVTHFLFMERPADFNSAVKAFVSKNKLL